MRTQKVAAEDSPGKKKEKRRHWIKLNENIKVSFLFILLLRVCSYMII